MFGVLASPASTPYCTERSGDQNGIQCSPYEQDPSCAEQLYSRLFDSQGTSRNIDIMALSSPAFVVASKPALPQLGGPHRCCSVSRSPDFRERKLGGPVREVCSHIHGSHFHRGRCPPLAPAAQEGERATGRRRRTLNCGSGFTPGDVSGDRGQGRVSP